eukprot:TRINITY_DN20861_c0_g1_i1.p1 TRINITY_DN20861_c0_g1~~TRINITY_DN20861_c0_g1_i1.p1  ORF type:complete len:203 (+),score=57.90 TRINITY_DN20861_c0_g1_i1:86-610(+)
MLRSLVGSEMCIRDSVTALVLMDARVRQQVIKIIHRAHITRLARVSLFLIMVSCKQVIQVAQVIVTIRLHLHLRLKQTLDLALHPGPLKLPLGRHVQLRSLEVEESSLLGLFQHFAPLLHLGLFPLLLLLLFQLDLLFPLLPYTCLLYTSDAADEEDSVDLGGRRIIKKKKNNR